MITMGNGIADVWLSTMWPVVLQSTLVAVAVYVLNLWLKKGPASLRYWLWMLVPFRLLVMPLLTISIPILPPTWQSTSFPEKGTVLPVPAELQAPAEETTQREWPSWIGLGREESIPTSVVPFASAQAAAVPKRPHIGMYLMVCWLIGVTVASARMVRAYCRFRRVVLNAEHEVPVHVREATARAARLVGLRRLPRVLLTRESVSPFSCGIGHPAIVLPTQFVERADSSGLLVVLAHEMAHLRRLDSVMGMVLALCEILYFFHPVVYIVKRWILLEREKASDELVLCVSKTRPSNYARAIAATIGLCEGSVKAGPAAVVTQSYCQIKQRLLAIGSNKQPQQGLSLRAVVCLVVLGAVCVPGIALTRGAAATPGSATAVQAASDPADRAPSDSGAQPANVEQRPETALRVLNFPEDASLGQLYLRQADSRRYRLGRESESDPQPEEYLGQAQGQVTVPMDTEVQLRVSADFSPEALSRLSALKDLGPDDLYALAFDFPMVRARCFVTDAQVLPYVANLTGLKVLELNGVEAAGRGLRYLRTLKGLEELSLGAEQFEDAALVHLGELRSLRVLNLYVPVTDDGLQYLSSLTSLRELSLKCQNVRGPGLAHLAGLPALELLELRGDGFTNKSGGPAGSALEHLVPMKALRSLLLYHCRNITDRDLACLSAMPSLEELKFIRESGVTDRGMMYIEKLPNLRRLDLSATHVSDRGLARLSALTELTELGLPPSLPNETGGYSITDQGLAYVASLSRLKRLSAGGGTPADLSDPGPFSDAGLSSISKLSRLESLSICSGRGVTEAGMREIANLSRLKDLALGCNGITNAGMAHLARLTSLQSLDLSDPGVTVAGINHLNALTGLKRLVIHESAQDGAGLDLSALTNLEMLVLNISTHPGTRARTDAIRDEDMRSLGRLTNLRNLQVGYSPGLTDAGMAQLAGLTDLERLVIGGEQVTDNGLANLLDKKHLWQLNLSGNFTDQGICRLTDLIGIKYMEIKSVRPLSPQTVQALRNMPNMYSFLESGYVPGRSRN